MPTYLAHDVAAELRRRLPNLPTKKLHKLLYYCQGYHAAAFGTELFSEAIEAWDRGPVVADFWREEKYGGLFSAIEPLPLGQAELNTIGYVVSRYGALTGADLEALTHHEPPWLIADARRKLTGDQRIELADIEAFFKSTPTDVFDAAFDDETDDYEPPAETIRQWLSGALDRSKDELTVDDLSELDRFARP